MAARVNAHGQLDAIETVDGLVVAGLLECEALVKIGKAPKLSEVRPDGSLVDYVLSRNVAPHRPESLTVAATLVLARPQFKEEMRAKMSSAAKAEGLGNIDHPLCDDERWWTRAARRWGCTPYHVKLMASVFDRSPAIFEAVRANVFTHSKEVRALINNPELRTEADRLTVIDLYAKTRRRGRNVLLDLGYHVGRKRRLRKLPRGLARGSNFALFEGDMAERATEVPDGSADLVIADIIYGDLKMAANVALFASRKLAPGGVLALYNGHERNVEALSAVGAHLELRATGWHRLPGSMRGAGTVVTRIEGLPIWFFCRPKNRPRCGIKHLEFTSARTMEVTKRLHPWEKSLDATLDLVRSIVRPDSLVVDPCCGSGTSGVAALMHGCRFIGIDIDPKAVEIARSRLTRVAKELPAKITSKELRKGGKP
jgi:hypothetical protein